MAHSACVTYKRIRRWDHPPPDKHYDALRLLSGTSLLSLPAFVAIQVVLRDLAPTRTVATGELAGLLAGALAASAYALHCPEMAAPFIGTWYLLGMLLPAAAGALLARQLRW